MKKEPKILFFDIEPYYKLSIDGNNIKIFSNHPRSKATISPK